MQRSVSRHHGGPIAGLLELVEHHSAVVLRGALSFTPIIPRDAGYSNNRCKVLLLLILFSIIIILLLLFYY